MRGTPDGTLSVARSAISNQGQRAADVLVPRTSQRADSRLARQLGTHCLRQRLAGFSTGTSPSFRLMLGHRRSGRTANAAWLGAGHSIDGNTEMPRPASTRPNRVWTWVVSCTTLRSVASRSNARSKASRIADPRLATLHLRQHRRQQAAQPATQQLPRRLVPIGPRGDLRVSPNSYEAAPFYRRASSSESHISPSAH